LEVSSAFTDFIGVVCKASCAAATPDFNKGDSIMSGKAGPEQFQIQWDKNKKIP